MSKIKLGMIGLGVMGTRMVQAIERHRLHNDLQVTAVCDVHASAVEQFASSLGDVYTTTDYRQLLQEADTDLIYVAAPPKYHYDIVLAAIAHGKHVLCEKPLANSVAQAAEMVTAARQAGIVSAMNFPLQYGVALNHYAQLIEEGYIGELRRLRLDMHFPHWPRAWQQNAWIASREQGGFVLEVGVHWIQAIQKIFGRIVTVESDIQLPMNGVESETSIVATMQLASGTTVTVDGVSGIAGNERIALVAYGTEGMLEIVNWGELYGGKSGQPLEAIAIDTLPPRTSLLEHVVRAIRGEAAEIYDFAVGYEAQVILEALRHPSAGGKVDVREQYVHIEG